MRSNTGGSPDTLALLASYLFEQAELPLFSLIPRDKAEVKRYTTASTPPLERNGTRPVYVLTSRVTFSGGEGLPYILQERKRAEVVGERTAGAANAGRRYPVNHRLALTVSNGKLETAITRSSWEGTGVDPDVAAPASNALRIAHTRALQRLLTMFRSGPWHESLKRHLAVMQGRR
jgi:C-terminal processing protease CtpA/Prc